MSRFPDQLLQLQGDLAAQGRQVLDLCTSAVECYFAHDQARARSVIEADDEVDRVDVSIERQSIPLLAMGETNSFNIRSVLTVVKVNNELERIADGAVSIAEFVVAHERPTERIPPTFRVMANSVLGMIRDAVKALDLGDAEVARQVLLFDDTVDRFKTEILMQAQEQVALGVFGVRFAFKLAEVTRCLERMADHSTNIAEQVIYLHTGKIVRHRPEGWSEPQSPART